MKNLYIKFVCLIFTLSVLLVACKKKKEDITPVVKDCETNNYGVVKVYFGSTTERHSILVTLPNSSAREKIVNTGNATDTMHLKPGSYPISISSINSMGQAIDTKNETTVITQCGEDAVSVTF